MLLNGSPSKWIKCRQGLRQGDPLSLALFILVTDVLSRILKQAGLKGIIEGISTKLTFSNLRSQDFDDDTLLFCASKKESVIAIKAILLGFEQASGLHNNFQKSSIISMNMEDNEVKLLTTLLNCKRSSFSFIYVGLPLSDRKLPKHCWLPLIKRTTSRLAA